MALGEWSARLRAGLAAGAGVVAILAAAPSGAWADQANDNSTTTNATGGDLLGDAVVAPLTAAVQANLACAPNINVAGSQRDGGSCAPGPQSNSNSSTTRAGAGSLVVAPVTAAVQANVSCPINVNVLANQRDSGSCAPGPQSNANGADTRVGAGGGVPGVLAGPLVAPITYGLGLDVTCPTNVNVLSSVRDSGDCIDTDTSSETPPPPTGETPPPGGGTSPPGVRTPAGGWPAPVPVEGVVPTGFTEAPGPPDTGALAIARPPVSSFPALGLLVLVVLASAAVATRRLHRER